MVVHELATRTKYVLNLPPTLYVAAVGITWLACGAMCDPCVGPCMTHALTCQWFSLLWKDELEPNQHN